MIKVFEDVQSGKYKRPAVKNVVDGSDDNGSIALFHNGMPIING